MPRALIVEDEPLLRAELMDQLRALWPELEIAGQAENGIDAVAAIDALKPDIVFLDIQMPGLNGMEVARHIPESCQVVFLTAYADYALAAFDAGTVAAGERCRVVAVSGGLELDIRSERSR